jgi:3-methyl-2-oxobutanoate hydroxymethyltransferase
MGHIGLTPQSVSKLGGYRVQGKEAAAARRLLEDALVLERAGCFALVLEAVPAPVAKVISDRLRIPTVGIGAGPGCDGQVLVYHDMLGLFDRFTPKFVKQYLGLNEMIRDAFATFRREVEAGEFPAPEHSYGMEEAELKAFLEGIAD